VEGSTEGAAGKGEISGATRPGVIRCVLAFSAREGAGKFVTNWFLVGNSVRGERNTAVGKKRESFWGGKSPLVKKGLAEVRGGAVTFQAPGTPWRLSVARNPRKSSRKLERGGRGSQKRFSGRLHKRPGIALRWRQGEVGKSLKALRIATKGSYPLRDAIGYQPPEERGEFFGGKKEKWASREVIWFCHGGGNHIGGKEKLSQEIGEREGS